MSFFKQFPTVNYDLNRDGSIMQLVNIFRSVRPMQNLVDDTSQYKFYEIENGERPDIVSQKLYGTPEFYWTFFVINDFLHDGYKVWPMSQEMLGQYLKEEYGGVAINTSIEFDANDTLEIFSQFTLSGKFEIGETVEGGSSGATGVVFKKDVDLNQLILKDVNGSFFGNGGNNEGDFEELIGLSSGSRLITDFVWNYAEAPHHYYRLENGIQRQYANTKFIDPLENEDIFLNRPEGNPYRIAWEDTALSYVSNRQYINQLNDDRSKIRVINPNYIGKFVEEFERLINE